MFDGSHVYDGVAAEFAALESQGDVFLFHDISNERLVDHVQRFYDELSLTPKMVCQKFTDRYPSGTGLGFGIGLCIRRALATPEMIVASIAARRPSTGSVAETADMTGAALLCVCTMVLRMLLPTDPSPPSRLPQLLSPLVAPVCCGPLMVLCGAMQSPSSTLVPTLLALTVTDLPAMCTVV